MKTKADMGQGDFQKLLQLTLQYLTLQQTIAENQINQLNEELRTLERDEEIDKLESALIRLRKDALHYQEFVDTKHPFELENYFEI